MYGLSLGGFGVCRMCFTDAWRVSGSGVGWKALSF